MHRYSCGPCHNYNLVNNVPDRVSVCYKGKNHRDLKFNSLSDSGGPSFFWLPGNIEPFLKSRLPHYRGKTRIEKLKKAVKDWNRTRPHP
ncbi:MAG: hypothetical protein ABIG30_01830 [Candidatus Aenigmatarchaeota archaeon]